MTDDMKTDDIARDDQPFGELQPSLAPLDVAPAHAEHIRRRAHAILRAEQAAPPVGSFAHRYQRSIEPALLIGLGVCQLLWAVHGTLQLFH